MPDSSNHYEPIKAGDMVLGSLSWFKIKSEELKEMLVMIMNENIMMKYRLSEVLKEKFDKNMLMEIEDYQSCFIKEDELIGLFRNDIAILEKKVKGLLPESKHEINLLNRKLTILHKNISDAVNQFYILKAEFIHYLSKNKLYWSNL